MMKILYKLKWFYIALVLVLLCVRCNPLNIFGDSSVEQYSLIEDDDLSGSNIPNAEFFYVNISASYYRGENFNPLDALIYALDEGPGTDCKIPVDAESTEDLYCVMDIMEGDLWFHRIVLEYNVPEEMCNYLGFDVPWHFNQRVGDGPSTVYECTDWLIRVEEGVPETDTRYCLGGCRRETAGSGESAELVTVECVGTGPAETTGPVQNRGSAETAEDFCSALNLSENGLSNCCFGNYTLINSLSNTETRVSWGGDNFRECLGGLGRFSWDTFDADGLPIKLVQNTERSGLNENYEIPRLVDTYNGTRNRALQPSFITANYWPDVEDQDSINTLPRVYRAPTASQLPATYFRPVRRTTGHPYLTWSCFDEAFEVRHRIHLIVREWNTEEEFTSFQETGGSRGDPDVVGQEGAFCEYYTADEENILEQDTECNDFLDMEDWEALNHGTGRRYNPYPEIIYEQE